jgi:calcium/calmodulin-dependent protein kinase I
MEKEFYSEKEAAETIRPIIDAIKYCHSLNIIHRDIKVFSCKLKFLA